MRRRLVIRGPMSAVWFLASGLCLFAVIQPQTANADEPRPMRRAFVPADRSRDWPRGDWIPIAADELNSLVRDAEARSEPSGAVIDLAEYSASPDGGTLAGGCRWDVRRLVDRPVAMPIESPGVAFSNFRWADGATVVWGLAPNGETLLIVDRPRGQINGDWRVPLRRLEISREAAMRLPAAAVSTAKIDLPQDLVLRSSDGRVEAGSATVDGLRPWRIHLGRARDSRLTIRPASASTTGPAALLVHQEFSGVVRPEGLRMQCDFQLEFLGAGRREVEFLVSPEFQVLFVQLTDGRALRWRESPESGAKRLTVDWPAAEVATRPSLRLQGTVPTQLDHGWTLPRVRVAAGVLIDGQFALRVAGPLELAWFKLQGCRQAGVVTEASGGETTLLKQFEPDAAIELLVRSRPFAAACRVTNRFDADGTQAALRSDVSWTVRSGEQFVTRYRIANGWEVADIEMQDGEDADLSAWSVAELPGTGHVLTVSFRNSLAVDRPKWLRVLLRRMAVEPPPAEFSPVVVPLDVDDVEQHLLPHDGSGKAAGANGSASPTERLRVTSLTLNSFFAWNHSGDDRHAARFQLHVGSGSDPLRFDWSLPEPAAMMRVTVNGHDLPPRTDGTVWSVDLDPRRLRRDLAPSRRAAGPTAGGRDDATACDVIVEYSQPASIRFGPVGRAVTVPRVALPVERFAWRVSASEAIVLDGEPQGVASPNPPADAWRTRLFGLLARPGDSRLFNPLRPRSWIDAWSDWSRESPRTTAAAADVRDPAGIAFAATASSIRQFAATDVPLEIRIRVWRSADATLLSWTALLGSLLAGLFLRLACRTRIDWLTIGLGLAALAVSLLASPVMSTIAGSAIVGLLVAQLLPWSWIRRPARGQSVSPQDVPAGSTQSFVLTPSLRSLIVVGAAAWCASAAAQVDEAPRAAEPLTFDVLIPTGPDGKPVAESDVVYVSSKFHTQLLELRKRHRAWRQRQWPACLISSASYAGDWDADERLRVLARFTVHVLSLDETVPVAIQLGGGPLARRDDCLVNGQPHAVLPIETEGAVGFVVPLPGIGRDVPGQSGEAPAAPPKGLRVRTDTIELRVHPRTETDSSVRSAQLDVPPVADSSVTLRRDSRQSVVDVESLAAAGATTPAAPVAAPAPISGWLAAPQRLHVRWSTQPLPPPNVGLVRARTVSLVDVQNTHLLMHFQTIGQVTGNEVRVLPLRVPRQAVVRSVRVRNTSVPVVPELPNQFPAVEAVEMSSDAAPASATAADADLRSIAIELPRPLPSEFVLELDAVLPLPPDSTEASVPVADVLATDRPGLIVTPAVPIVAVRAPVVMEVDVRPANDEAVRPVAGDEIVSLWPDVAKLAATLAVHEPTTLGCRMSRPRPVRSGRSAMQVRVGMARLECTWTADVETLTTPAYQHQLRIDPRLRIVDVSVTEDAAERLLRWSRAGDIVTLFLSDKTVSRQTVRLRAVLPVQPPQEVPLPRVELLNATLDGPELVLRHQSAVEMEVAQPGNLARVKDVDDEPDANDRDRVLGRFQMQGVTGTVLLRVGVAAPPAAAGGSGAMAADAAKRGLDRVAAATQRRLGGDWTVADVWRIATAVVVCVLVFLLALWFRRFQVRRWLNEHESFALLLLGCLWWFWWMPSWLGCLIVAAAMARGVIHRRRGTASGADVPDGQFPITV